LSKGDNTVLAEIRFDKAVSFTIFRCIIHPGCSLFIHFLPARCHGNQVAKNLLFTVCIIGCLTRYHLGYLRYFGQGQVEYVIPVSVFVSRSFGGVFRRKGAREKTKEDYSQ